MVTDRQKCGRREGMDGHTDNEKKSDPQTLSGDN